MSRDEGAKPPRSARSAYADAQRKRETRFAFDAAGPEHVAGPALTFGAIALGALFFGLWIDIPFGIICAGIVLGLGPPAVWFCFDAIGRTKFHLHPGGEVLEVKNFPKVAYSFRINVADIRSIDVEPVGETEDGEPAYYRVVADVGHDIKTLAPHIAEAERARELRDQLRELVERLREPL